MVVYGFLKCISFVLLIVPVIAQNVTLTSSNLPILIITTEGRANIPDEPKIEAHLGIINNGRDMRNNITDPFNDYDGVIGIEIRGNASASFPKKPYDFETRDSTGANLNVSLLGMPRENDWILRAAYIDKTLMRDHLAYYLSRQSGRWASRTRHCELVLNGIYQGIYILTEQIKPDRNRLNIIRMDTDDIAGDSLTGGYIYEVSQSGEDFGLRRRYKYPQPDNITPEQKTYIRMYDDNFRSVMESDRYADPVAGYAAWIDIDRFIDEILVQEVCKNSDAYGWSSYFYKDRLGKLCAGPAWDFDQALSNSTFNDGPNYMEWIITKSEWDSHLRDNHPPFWRKLFAESKFKLRLAQRWFDLRANGWATNIITQFIDNTAAYLDEAQQRNFTRWPILGQEIWRNTPGWAQRNTYQKEVNYMKTFLQSRLTWMDSQLQQVIDDETGTVQLAKGLVGYYPMDEGSGNTTVNTAPGDDVAPNGQLINDPQWVPGKSGNAIRFDSQKNGYIDLNNYDPSKGADALSVSCWINWDGEDGNWQGICAKRSSWEPSDILWSMVLDINSGGIQFETNTTDQGKVFIISPSLPIKEWMHLSLVYADSWARFYMNGTLVSEGYMVLGDNRNAAFLVGCGEPNGSVAFSGIIDELRFYNRALNTSEVRTLNNLDSSGSENSLTKGILGFQLYQNYPNPFNPQTHIDFNINVRTHVNIDIFDLTGRKVASPIDEIKSPGSYGIVWNGTNQQGVLVPSGIYFYRLRAADMESVKRMILIR